MKESCICMRLMICWKHCIFCNIKYGEVRRAAKCLCAHKNEYCFGVYIARRETPGETSTPLTPPWVHKPSVIVTRKRARSSHEHKTQVNIITSQNKKMSRYSHHLNDINWYTSVSISSWICVIQIIGKSKLISSRFWPIYGNTIPLLHIPSNKYVHLQLQT